MSSHQSSHSSGTEEKASLKGLGCAVLYGQTVVTDASVIEQQRALVEEATVDISAENVVLTSPF